LIGIGALALPWRKYVSNNDDIFTIGVPAYWETLVPPLQYTLVGDGVIEHQFEPLIRTGEKGIAEPLAAASWEYGADQKVLRFRIDTSRRFSDGSYLRAGDFKRSWEDGLKMDPNSSNSSLADGLGGISGFSEFAKKGTLDGVRVTGEDTLELRFDRPVRLVLEHLSGGRFSAYKMSEGRSIGTGPYVISERDRVLTLTPNPYHPVAPKLKKVKVVVTQPSDALEALRSGKIDAFLFAETAKLPDCGDERLAPVKCADGQEGLHVFVGLNGMKGRLFSDPKHRSAFQALILRNIALAEAAFNARGFIRDSQSFLKFQSGRIPDQEAREIIDAGSEHIERLVAATRTTPLYLTPTPGWKWFADLLQSNGIRLDERSGSELSDEKYWEMYYKTFAPDLVVMGASVSDGDPDGLYHLLGRKGAIFSPMLERKDTCDGMEEGHNLLDLSRLPAHYQGVSRNILREVPYVHLGYYYRRIAYNSERLSVNEPMISRNNLNILALEPR